MRTIFNIIFALAATYTLLTSASLFNEGECDNGACLLLYIFYSLPLLLSWIFTIAALNFAVSTRKIFFIFLLPAVLFNLMVLIPEYTSLTGDLEAPAYFLIGAQFLVLMIYITFRIFLRAKHK